MLRQAHVASCDENERGALERLIEPLMSLIKSYEGGRESHACVIVRSLFEEYLSIEELFNDNMLVIYIYIIFIYIYIWFHMVIYGFVVASYV